MNPSESVLDRRSFLGALAAGMTGAAFTGCARGGMRAGAPKWKPNVIIIFTDDQGYQDLSCFGSPDIETPRIDRMAAEGMRFTDFYVAASVCTPSRAALLTGCYPQRIGMGRPGGGGVLFPESNYGLNPDEITIAEVLKPLGYATACIGKWHLGDAKPFLPTRQGFDYYYGIPYSNDMRISQLMRNEEVIEQPVHQPDLVERYSREAISFIEANADRPFFLYLPHTMPHMPICTTDRFKGQSDAGLYGDVIESIDWSTGRILDTLAALGLDKDTLVIFTSDNGPWLVYEEKAGRATPLRAGKATAYEGGHRVPCVMRWPGHIPPGRVCRELATTMDFLPTIAAVTGAEMPQDRIIDGKNIWPLMAGNPGATTPHDAYYYYCQDHLQAVRSGKWKLMFERLKYQETPYKHMIGKVEDPYEVVPEALYNLETDVGEQHNVLEEHPEVAVRLRKLADRIREDIGDVPVRVPTGTINYPAPTEGRNRRPIGRIQPASGE